MFILEERVGCEIIDNYHLYKLELQKIIKIHEELRGTFSLRAILKEVIQWEISTVTEEETDLRKVSVPERCIRQFAPSAARNVKFLSSRQKAETCFAKNVSRKRKGSN